MVAALRKDPTGWHRRARIADVGRFGVTRTEPDQRLDSPARRAPAGLGLVVREFRAGILDALLHVSSAARPAPASTRDAVATDVPAGWQHLSGWARCPREVAIAV